MLEYNAFTGYLLALLLAVYVRNEVASLIEYMFQLLKLQSLPFVISSESKLHWMLNDSQSSYHGKTAVHINQIKCKNVYIKCMRKNLVSQVQ